MSEKAASIVNEARFYATEIFKLKERTSSKNLQIAREFQLLVDNPPRDVIVLQSQLEQIRGKLSVDMLMHILPQYKSSGNQ